MLLLKGSGLQQYSSDSDLLSTLSIRLSNTVRWKQNVQTPQGFVIKALMVENTPKTLRLQRMGIEVVLLDPCSYGYERKLTGK